ncbi:MAG: DUF1080 domain-containing protein [Cyclobacteriaceae bacterium]|nr:DUF1080 domain-containing protein [Cyclobacteriaceae bacterium]
MITKIKHSAIVLSLAIAITSCGMKESTTESSSDTSEKTTTSQETVINENTLSDQEVADGWKLLFDGKQTSGWRGYNQETLPEAWIVEEGTLKSLGQGGDIGGDIVFDEVFGEFELYLEWKISEGGNSGIFYHVVEGEQYHAPYENAPEYQVIDDLGFPNKLEDWQSLGADYAMYVPDQSTKKVKPAGEWNTSRIIFTNNHVEYWLNGQKTVEFTPWSDDWNERRNSGKWEDMPDYGKAKEGLIGLQDHGSFIWYKNVKIKKL